MNYVGELARAMSHLAEHPKTIFLGQGVAYPGTAMHATLDSVPPNRRLEMPVSEDMQAGVANGLALSGLIPVSIYPRWNFFLLATNQIVNHLDKISEYSDYRPKVIVRVAIGAVWPWNSQAQHIGDYTDVFKSMLKNLEVIRLDAAEDVFPAYRHALDRDDGKSTLLVEWNDFYYPRSPVRPDSVAWQDAGLLHEPATRPGIDLPATADR